MKQVQIHYHLPVMKKKKTAPRSSRTNLVGKPLSKDHERFYKDHPNADMLIKIFLVSFVLLAVMYVSKMY